MLPNDKPKYMSYQGYKYLRPKKSCLQQFKNVCPMKNYISWRSYIIANLRTLPKFQIHKRAHICHISERV